MAVEPVDFRKGIGALKALCRQKLRDDRFSVTVFVFTNCMRTAVKLLVMMQVVGHAVKPKL
ncbi:IS66 family insertion sequence element accessory protein TnpB [Legionella sainthelensi]|uniref:IS66 family insertion sequence element accessory protein TnpB n=1 Tax=Legionella sainthelensi TaxID=28087 RepID=UPI0013E3AC17|nr:IS66 family insertion sequence element accessory protein TnpB [Legionella sainthelensi]